MKLIFRLIGLAVTIVIVAVVGMGVYGFLHRGDLVESAVVEATGNQDLAGIAHKIAIGEDPTDEELQELLGVDSKTYKSIKKSAESLGIDPNNGKQLQEIATKNADKFDDVRTIAEQVQAGKLTTDQAMEKLAKTLDLP